jgi:hypothetical protein
MSVSISYRSGASAPGIMRGYIVSGVPIGVSLAELSVGGCAWDMMIEYASRGGEVFVDSGAFTACTHNEPMNWPKVAATYRKLVHEAPGTRMHLVMPDVIGNQAASLELLAEWKELVELVIGAGHDAMVPIQKGALAPYEAYRAAVAIIGSEDITVSVPSNQAAFSAAELANLVGGAVKPARLHLLGIAANKKKLAGLLAVIAAASPGTLVTTDAARIRAQVGQGRPITMNRVTAAAFLTEAFAWLLEEQEELWSAFVENAEKIIAPGVAAMSIHAVEATPIPRAESWALAA